VRRNDLSSDEHDKEQAGNQWDQHERAAFLVAKNRDSGSNASAYRGHPRRNRREARVPGLTRYLDHDNRGKKQQDGCQEKLRRPPPPRRFAAAGGGECGGSMTVLSYS